MADRFTSRRAGMTLVELLVVVAIIGLLAVTVLPSLANSTEGRRTRETVRGVTSFIAQSQAKAFGHSTGAGFGLVRTGTLASDPTLELASAVIPDPYRGDTSSSRVSLSTLNSGSMSLAFTPANSSFQTVSCTTGDLIRFEGRGAWYSLQGPLTGTGAPTSCSLRSTAAVDQLAGQTAMNTPWPSTSGTYAFEILRGPQRTSNTVALGDQRCVDTFWSFAGTRQLTSSSSPVIYVIFDSAGSVRQVTNGQDRFSPDGPILLLVGRVDRAGVEPVLPPPTNGGYDSQGANWQYADSMWVAIDPISGICRTAACDAVAAAQSPPATLTTEAERIAWRLRESQNFIRSALLTGVQ